jgi:hypothetical protein
MIREFITWDVTENTVYHAKSVHSMFDRPNHVKSYSSISISYTYIRMTHYISFKPILSTCTASTSSIGFWAAHSCTPQFYSAPASHIFPLSRWQDSLTRATIFHLHHPWNESRIMRGTIVRQLFGLPHRCQASRISRSSTPARSGALWSASPPPLHFSSSTPHRCQASRSPCSSTSARADALWSTPREALLRASFFVRPITVKLLTPGVRPPLPAAAPCGRLLLHLSILLRQRHIAVKQASHAPRSSTFAYANAL